MCDSPDQDLRDNFLVNPPLPEEYRGIPQSAGKPYLTQLDLSSAAI